jgi:hypothetical protein
MTRENIDKDGDCCFRSVARNICTKRTIEELNEEAKNHLTGIGIYNKNEDEMTRALRSLTVQEWRQNRSDYESFLTTDDFDEEVERFQAQGYFAGELGNVMTLGMSNMLKMPIIIFSSLENYPVIPVLPRHQLKNITPLYVCFNGAGCGHYDSVKLKLLDSSVQESVQEIIMHQKSSGNDIIDHETLDIYNFIQSVNNQAERPLLSLRKKELNDIKKALAAHKHQVSLMRAIFNKQVEMSFTTLK